MNQDNARKCLYSKDSIQSEGPVTLEELKKLHSDGSLSNEVLCSELGDYGGGFSDGADYFLWRPIIRYLLKRQEFDSRANGANSIHDILQIYSGWFIGLNLVDPKSFEVVRLDKVNEDSFTVSLRQGEDRFHYPFRQLISFSESLTLIDCKMPKPVDRTLKQSAISKFLKGDAQQMPPDWVKVRIEVPLLIEIFHVVVYKGSIGVGVSMPVGHSS